MDEGMDERPMVLVIDDEPAILRIVTLALADTGVAVVTANDGESATAFLETHKPDMIIADVRLPGIDGVEIARRVKENPALSSIPVLLMSAYDEPRGHPANAFLPKPFDIDQFSERVTEFLNGSASG